VERERLWELGKRETQTEPREWRWGFTIVKGGLEAARGVAGLLLSNELQTEGGGRGTFRVPGKLKKGTKRGPGISARKWRTA